MAAVEFIESRIKQLAEQCARTIEQEFEEYERTSREAEEEGDVDMLAEIAADIQAKVKAAISLKRKLLDRAKATYEDPLDAAASDDQSTVEDELLSKRDDEEQHSDGAKLVEEELPDESVDGSLGSEDNTEEKMPAASKLIEEDEISGADEGTTAVKYSPLEGVFDSGILTEEKVQITSDLAEPDSGLAKPDLLTVQRKEVQATEDASMSKSALNGEDGIPIVAELVEESVAAVEIVSVEEGEVAHGEITQAVITEVLVDLEDTGTVLGVKQTQVEVIKFADAENLSEVGSSKQDMVFMNGEQLEAHVNFPNEGVEMELMVELEDAAAEQVQVGQLPPDRSTRVRVQPGSSVPDEEFVEKAEHKKKDTDESTQVDSERFHLHEKEFVTHGSDMDLRVEQQGSEIAHEERVTVEEASTNVAELERPTAESASERNYDRVDIEAVAATLGEVETLEMERVVVANEFQELEQLERMLLQEEGERVRVEEELRVIAEEEEVWLQNEQEAAEGVASSDDLAFEDSSTATIDAAKTADVDVDQKSSTAIPAVELPGPTLVQISLLSVAFLALAVLAAYLLDRHLKRGLFARAPRRRRRWKRRAASDAEEVVLMPDDSSDDEAETDTTIVKSSFEVMELRSSVSADVKTRALVSSGGEDADVEEETSEDHEEVEEAKEITEDGGVAVSDPESAKSKSVIVKRVQTTTTYVEDHAASHSEASVIDAAYLSAGSGSTAAPSSSISTPPSGSPEGTPDTSQRALRRRRRELRS
ncbi:putative transmembrane protein [Phytophthora cinnamomi]|uniref:putative transmembrane protein n=1 Tax=Phytophthora cinnamomi TaxID=4785 RepID=UPI00355A3282|nr:putative transmembrane protein [Phytophthora cinnamomi]